MQTTDSRSTDDRNPLPGTVNYIKNTATRQTSVSFNSGGNGVVGGNFGVGTATSLTRFRVKTGTGFYGFTHTDGAITVGSYSRRHKENVQPFTQGLSLIQRLRPVTFNWKQGQAPDLGLIAEGVAAVEPLLTTQNQKGGIEGIKYQPLNVVSINAVKQQAQIEAQRRQYEEQEQRLEQRLVPQQARIEALKRSVCRPAPDADLCKP